MILAVGVAVIVTAVLVLSIGRLAGFTALGDTLNGATWGWLGLCALGQIGVFIGYAGAFRASVAGSGDLFGEPADTDSNDTDSNDIDSDDTDSNDTDSDSTPTANPEATPALAPPATPAPAPAPTAIPAAPSPPGAVRG